MVMLQRNWVIDNACNESTKIGSTLVDATPDSEGKQFDI